MTLLPLSVQSKKDHIYIDTFPINKQQELSLVPLIPELMNSMNENHSSLEPSKGYSLLYKFSSPMGSIFQAEVLTN